MLGGKRNEVETSISHICLHPKGTRSVAGSLTSFRARLFFPQSLISNEMTYFWTDTRYSVGGFRYFQHWAG